MKGQKKLKGEWKNVGGCVYESNNGDRIHIHCLIRKSGRMSHNVISTGNYTECMKITGQNNKRSLMLVCECLI